jgi:hypothetical protein
LQIGIGVAHLSYAGCQQWQDPENVRGEFCTSYVTLPRGGHHGIEAALQNSLTRQLDFQADFRFAPGAHNRRCQRMRLRRIAPDDQNP